MPRAGRAIWIVAWALLALCGRLWGETTVPAGVIYGSTTWTMAGSPYILTGGVAVYGPTRPRLTIEPGVELRFGPGAWLQIGQTGYPHAAGQLTAVGTAEQPILFTAGNGLVGGWEGLRFPGGSGMPGLDSRMEHCIVEYAASGVLFTGATTPDTLADCTFRHSGARALELVSSRPVLARCLFEYNPTAIRVCNTLPTVIGGDPLLANRFLDPDQWFVENTGSAIVDARFNHWCLPEGQELETLIRDQQDNSALGAVTCLPMAPGPRVDLQLRFLPNENLLLLDWQCDPPAHSYTVLVSPSGHPDAEFAPITVTTQTRLELPAPRYAIRYFFRVAADPAPCDRR
jgi:hypothetical protein